MEQVLHKSIRSFLPTKKEARPNTIEVRPYCLIELCHMYQISPRTFKKWLLPFADEIGKKNGRFYTVLQVSLIFDKLGLPHFIFDIE